MKALLANMGRFQTAAAADYLTSTRLSIAKPSINRLLLSMTDRILRIRIGGGPATSNSPIDNLSDRELEVLTLIGQGNTTGAIAKKLHLSVHTIDTCREKLKLSLAIIIIKNRFLPIEISLHDRMVDSTIPLGHQSRLVRRKSPAETTANANVARSK